MTHLISMKTRIMTPKLAETRDWYRDLLGLALLEEWDEPGDAGCILGLRSGDGDALLELYHNAKVADFWGTGLQFRVEDVDAFSIPDDDRFRSRGPVSRPWGSRYLLFEDPNGVSVVIFSGSSL